MTQKVFVYTEEEMIDGEVTFKVKVCSKLNKALELRNESINDLKEECIFAERVYSEEDYQNAEDEKTDESYFLESSEEDGYYLKIDISEEEILD